MKNNYYFLLIFLLGILTSSCSDDDVVSIEGNENPEREFMTMFRTDNNTGKGDSDPYRSQVVNINDVHLYWYGVKDCAGYEVKMALTPNVSSGKAEDWENPDHILWDTIVGPAVLDIVIENLQYSTDHRFAIRTLSKKGEGYHSKWYGYGDGRQWADYFGLTTEERYNVPEVLVISQVTKNTFRVNIDRAYATSGDDKNGTFKKHFEIDDKGNFVMQTLSVEPSPTNPDATVGEKWRNYTITQEDFERGYIDIDGLQENCVYVVNSENHNIPIHWDAIYNTCVIRTDGEPGEPILIEHYCDPNDTIPGAVDFNACRIDTILKNYLSDATLAEGTIFELEGGKTYYIASHPTLCKGLTLRTKPDSGKNARVLMGGLRKVNGKCDGATNFMFGREPQFGELGGINVKSVIFENIDFDCPHAQNYADLKADGTGNYFANMFSGGMAVSFQSIEIRGCTFQRMVRGFVRVQGTKRKNFEKFLVEDCLFYNCGFHNNDGRGYAWIAGDGNNAKSNIFGNMIFRRNTFYDSPRTCLFTDNGKDLAWGSDIHYNITIENNTFVNFSTRSKDRHLFDFKFVPGGSKFTIRKNLIILTKQEGDTRNMYMSGTNIRTISGSGVMEFDVADNYSTSSNLTNGQIFTGYAFNAKKNSIGKYPDMCVNGPEQLEVHLGKQGISPLDLMVNPNPPHKDGDINMHEVDNLDGLYYKNTDAVRNHEIYKLGIGDPRWAKNVMP